jgi:hypothetical protein
MLPQPETGCSSVARPSRNGPVRALEYGKLEIPQTRMKLTLIQGVASRLRTVPAGELTLLQRLLASPGPPSLEVV